MSGPPAPWNSFDARPFIRTFFPTVKAGMTVEGSSLYTTLVLGDPVLRLRVLDCRSGAPLADTAFRRLLLVPAGTPPPEKGKEKEFDAQYAALHLPSPIDWDVRSNPPLDVDGKGHLKSDAGYAKGDWSKLKRALSALGHAAGSGKDETAKLRMALTQFRAAHGIEEPKPKAKDPATIPRVVAEYNRRCYAMIQRYLTTFGHRCDADQGTWGKASKAAYADWRRIHRPGKKPLELPIAEDAALLARENTHFKTSSSGIARVPVPFHLIEQGFDLVVELEDHAFVAAGDIGPKKAEGAPSIEWVATQDAAAGTWGWRYRKAGDARRAKDLPEFRAFQSFSVAALPKILWRSLTDKQAADAKFAPDFRELSCSAEIDVLAMVWCQPAWDDYEDPKKGRTNHNVCMPSAAPAVRHHRLHVVTTPRGGGTVGRTRAGEGYGLLDRVPDASTGHYRGRSGGHKGLDIQVTMGSPVFAVHAGSVHTVSEPDGAGYYVVLTNASNARICLWYFHLRKDTHPKGQVRAGEIVGYLGRTGNINRVEGPPARGLPHTPSHVHMQHANLDVGQVFALAEIPDAANRVCIPSNTTVPRLFPCRCEMQPDRPQDDDLRACGFRNKAYTDDCWAAAALLCPHMGDAGVEAFRHQAQLRWLAQEHPKTYLDPGTIDGDIGKNVRKAVAKFREVNGLPKGDALDAATVAKLDELAPILAPEA
jgi:hypothetical protein